jgi:hypothetical protein
LNAKNKRRSKLKTSKITVNETIDGEDRIVETYSAGPRNLLSAIACLQKLGCGENWIEIAGVVFTINDVQDISKSPTQKAAELITEALIYVQHTEHMEEIIENERLGKPVVVF